MTVFLNQSMLNKDYTYAEYQMNKFLFHVFLITENNAWIRYFASYHSSSSSIAKNLCWKCHSYCDLIVYQKYLSKMIINNITFKYYLVADLLTDTNAFECTFWMVCSSHAHSKAVVTFSVHLIA